jgi:hypothetical protein
MFGVLHPLHATVQLFISCCYINGLESYIERREIETCKMLFYVPIADPSGYSAVIHALHTTVLEPC